MSTAPTASTGALNFVCEAEGSASAVLIRALEPTHGMPAMRRRRGLPDERALCSGPGKLCEALGITIKHSELPLDAPPIRAACADAQSGHRAGVRIGITKAVDLPWRYGLKESKFRQQGVLTELFAAGTASRAQRSGRRPHLATLEQSGSSAQSARPDSNRVSTNDVVADYPEQPCAWTAQHVARLRLREANIAFAALRPRECFEFGNDACAGCGSCMPTTTWRYR